MRLFLHEDLVKAIGGPEMPAPPTPAGAPSAGGDSGPAQDMQPCSVGGGEACLRAGGNGGAQHKTGGAVERKHSEWRSSQGAGAPQQETAAPATELSPEEAQKTVQDTTQSTQTLDPGHAKGTTSTDPSSYPANSKPLDHYKVGAGHAALGQDNDSAKEITEGHRKIARQRSEGLSADEHDELANQLREAGLADDADYHAKQSGEAREREKESVDVEAARQEAADLGPRMVQQKEEAATDKKKVQDEATRLKDEDPHTHAMQEWEQQKSELDDKYQQDVESHKIKIDEEHDKTTKEWEDKKKERDAWESLKAEHTEKKPEPPEPVTAERPKSSDYAMDTPAGQKKFDSDVKTQKKAKDQYKKDQARHKSQVHAHKAEGIALNKQRSPTPGKKPKKASYTKGAPKKPKYPDQPKAEDYETKKPQSAAEKATHSEYTQSAKKARDNIQSHIENNPDLTDEDHQKLQAAHEALGAHSEAARMPTKEQSAEAKKMSQVAGKHGKEAYQSPEELQTQKDAQKKAKEEPARPPETDLEKIQVADHKSRAQQMRDNIQSHIDTIQRDETMSAEQRDSHIQKLQQIHQTLESHTQLEDLPSSEQQAELQELTKLSGEHGKKPAEQAGGAGDGAGDGGGVQKPQREAKGRPKDWAAAFGRGARTGAQVAEGMRTGTGAAQGTMAGVNAAAGGVVSTGDTLLAKPTADAVEARKKAADDEAKAADDEAKAAQKKSEETVKGLYLNLGADLDLLKAVTSPNAGSTTLSDKRAQRKVKESYAKNPVGVMGGAGIAMEDDPDVGRKWKHSEEDSVDAELEEDVRNKDTEKSLATVLLKSLRTMVEEEVRQYKPTETETVFMRDVLGYNEADIQKGLFIIAGRDRHRFHEWMIGRMHDSLGSMLECVNG